MREFKNWVDKYKAYHSTSQMDKLAITEQKQYLFKNIDLHLQEKLRKGGRVQPLRQSQVQEVRVDHAHRERRS